MPRYAIIENGVVTSISETNTAGSVDVTDSPWVTVGLFYDGEVFSFNPPPIEDTRITKLAFKQRLAQAERIAVREAAKINAIVYDFQDLGDSATFVDLSRQDTIDGLNTLEAAGLLGVGRANEILTTPIQEIERFNG